MMIFLQPISNNIPHSQLVTDNNSTVEWFEYMLVTALVCAQVWLLIQTIIKIWNFRGLLSQPPQLSIDNIEVDYNVSNKEINAQSDLFKHFQVLEKARDQLFEQQKVEPIGDFFGVEMIGYSDTPNVVTINIINMINRYLLKSRGQVSDFTLIKDVVERQSDALEEEISLALPLPLYLGLLGTMVGIIIGVYNMSSFTGAAEAKQLGEGISVLLGGVKVAMIASASGLLITVILSLYFRGTKSKVEAQKNSFYSLLQSELLPLLNESVASSIGNLQSNLMRFNDEFGKNLVSLNEVMRSNELAILQQQEAIEAQRELAREIKDADLGKLANANVTIWRELKVGVGQLEQFNNYLKSLNSFVTSSQILESRISELLDRTNQFGELYNRSIQSAELNEKLLNFLQSHFSELEKRKDLINHSLLHVDNTVSQGFDELRDHLIIKVNDFKSTLVKEEDLMSQALASNRTNLDKLRYLKDIFQQLELIQDSYSLESEKLRQTVSNLDHKVNNFHQLIEQEINQNMIQRMRSWFIKPKYNPNNK